MIISIKKSLTKFNRHLIKTLQKAGTEGTYLNIKRSYTTNPQQILSQWQKIESISFKIRNKTRVSTLTATINIVLEVLATAIRAEKEIKGIRIGKEVKLSLFAEDMILYIENPKDSTSCRI